MNFDFLDLLVNPYSGEKLQKEEGCLVDPLTMERFQIQRGIPLLLRKEDVKGLNELYQKRYDALASFYDLAMKIGSLVGGKEAFRSIAEIIEFPDTSRVLETSVGTGLQVKNLHDYGHEAEYYGVDISFGMLKKCRRNCKKWGVDIGLVQANAEMIPFPNEMFDVVFHIGGINFFNDKARAIEEMIRVAKPGAHIYIGDESAKQVNKQPRIISRFYQKPDPQLYDPPVQYIPEGMEDIATHSLWNGMIYLISFRKPPNALL